MAGWWAEVHAHFGVTLAPEVGFTYGGPSQEFGVAVAPEVGMSGIARNTATFGLALPTQIGMSGGGKSVASFGLTLNPYIAMREPGGFTPLFPSEELFPSTSLFPTPRSQRPGFGMTLTPTVGFGSAGVRYTREFEVSVSPSVGMSASERYASVFDLAVTPEVGMSAVERYARTFGVSVTPTMGMDAVGNNGVDPVAYNAVGATGVVWTSFGGTQTETFNFTAAAGADVFVAVSWDRSEPSITGITYGGVAMTQLAIVSHNNDATRGSASVWRLAAAGSGSAKSVAITHSGSMYGAANVISATHVGSVSTATAYGSGASPSQAVTVPAGGLVIHVLAAGNGSTGSVSSWTSYSGMTNRSLVQSDLSRTQVALSTASASGTVSATSSGSNPWSGISVALSPI
ncbi:minor tail protein [Mycobacterium phage RitaG]|uniref:Minor tail protein n=1 Tax=Mycobacterium phage RitaG TaxID=2027900 RepID=A0A249XQ00_9CAUD|nr:minor tail protein [Mycobacterium phage RitaG]ASZ73796.1 minor tail protein [Mycobacterium phage RitaG]